MVAAAWLVPPQAAATTAAVATSSKGECRRRDRQRAAGCAVAKLEKHHCVSLRRVFVVQPAAAQHQPSVGMGGDVLFVGDHDDGAALAVQPVEQLQDLVCGLQVQAAGGFVDQQKLGVADQRPSDGHALHLAAGELAGVVLGAV